MTDGTMVQTTAGVKGNQENQLRNGRSLATFLNYDLHIEGLKISPGIRFENINFDFQNYGNADNARLGTALKTAENELAVLLPGVGFNYRFNESFNILGGIHRGFSPPGMPSVTSSTGQAKMESSTNYELGYQLDKGGFSAKMVGFFNNYNNILGSDNISGGGAGTGDMFNAGNAYVQGLEISLEYNLLQRRKSTTNLTLPVSIAYTFTDAEFQETFLNGGGDWGSGLISKGDKIPFITPHLLTGNIGLSSNKMDLTLTSRYTGITRVSPGKDDYIFPGKKVKYMDINALNGFLLMDLSVNYRFTKSFTAFTTINNLTNNKGIVANLPQGFRPNMPLNINLGFKINF
jgi:Fe(3+) dicitrate transport protein